MRRTLTMAVMAPGALPGGCISSFALNPSLDINQYAHTMSTTRDGFPFGNIYAIARTLDGYLWPASEFGLFRFDGVRHLQWPRPGGELSPWALNPLAARDGTQWIGTYEHGTNIF